MRVAVPYDNGEVFQHFGRTGQFKVYEIYDGRVVYASVAESGGEGHGALAKLLSDDAVDAVICGGIGPGAVNALSSLGIRVIPGASGRTDDVIDSFIKGTLKTDSEPVCDCSGHSCSCSHKC